jgi:hypothetical protein
LIALEISRAAAAAKLRARSFTPANCGRSVMPCSSVCNGGPDNMLRRFTSFKEESHEHKRLAALRSSLTQSELGAVLAACLCRQYRPGYARLDHRGSGGSPCEGRERGGRPPREAGVAPPRFPYLGTTSLERSTRPAGGYPFWETPDPRSGPTQEKSRALRDAEQGTCQRRGSNLSKPPGVNGRKFASWGL